MLLPLKLPKLPFGLKMPVAPTEPMLVFGLM